MTSGQTFYLVLFGLYVTSCLMTGSKNAIVIRKKFLKKGWSLGHPFAFLGGRNRSLIFSHISPLHSYTVIANQENKEYHKIIPTRHAQSILKIIAYAASKLRFFTFLVFYLYFIVIPFTYYNHGDEPITYLIILITLISSIIPIIYFFLLHKKLAPLEKDVRWKNVFYAFFMPWHSMRLADFLFDIPHLRRIHPLNYAAITSGEASLEYLSQQYRNTLHLSRSLYTKEEFDGLFANSEFKALDFISPPVAEDPSEEQYCPCCHSLFTSKANQCDECENITLLSLNSAIT